MRLSHLGSGKADRTIKTAVHPHLVRYGSGRMLLTWGSRASMLGRTDDAGTGEAVGMQFRIAVRDHNYQAFKSYADGSSGGGGSIKIARALPVA